jgi:GTP pyrophosphokinase
MEATTDEREGRIEMTVEVNDLKHLDKVIKSLRGVDGVLNVERAAR